MVTHREYLRWTRICTGKDRCPDSASTPIPQIPDSTVESGKDGLGLDDHELANNKPAPAPPCCEGNRWRIRYDESTEVNADSIKLLGTPYPIENNRWRIRNRYEHMVLNADVIQA